LRVQGGGGAIYEACLVETNVWRIKTALIVQQKNLLTMITFGNSLNLKNPSLEYPTACCKFDSCGSHLTVAGHVTKVLFSVIIEHLNEV